MIKAKRGLFPAYIENGCFENALQVFGVKCTRFKGGTPGSPNGGRHFLLMLDSGRFPGCTALASAPMSPKAFG